jgi:hypothetical protein
MTAPSVWGCVEMDAASRDFDHANYLNFHERSGCKGAPLSAAGYALVRMVLNDSIEASMQEKSDGLRSDR